MVTVSLQLLADISVPFGAFKHGPLSIGVGRIDCNAGVGFYE